MTNPTPFLREDGIETLYCKGMGYTNAMQIAKTSEEPYIFYQLSKDPYCSAPYTDAIFFTCMASPIDGVVDVLEKETEKPLVSCCSAALYGVLKQLATVAIYEAERAISERNKKTKVLGMSTICDFCFLDGIKNPVENYGQLLTMPR